MMKERVIGYLSYVFVIFFVGLFYNINSPDFGNNYDVINHLFYTILSSFGVLLVLLVTDIIVGNISRKEYLFQKDKIGSSVLMMIVCGFYFVFPNVNCESLIMWFVVILFGEILRHLFLFYKLNRKH